MARFSVTATGASIEQLTAARIRALRDANRRIGREIRRAGTTALRNDLRRRLGGRMRFAGYRLNVKAKVKPSASRVEVDFYGTPVGFWSMLESGAKPHAIRPKAKKALSWGSGDAEVARSVDHPGMAGRGVWSAARPALADALDDVVADEYEAVLTRG